MSAVGERGSQDQESGDAARLRRVEPYGLWLLEDLLSQIESEIAEILGIGDLNGGSQFALLTMTQSLAAGQQACRLLLDGHPRLSLYMGRLLLEGYVSVAWSMDYPDEARAHFQNYLNSRSRLNDSDHCAQCRPMPGRGNWPDYRVMVKSLFKAGGRHMDDDESESTLRQIRDAQNGLFSHAVSDYSLEFAVEERHLDESVPVTEHARRDILLHEAMKHLVWLLGLTLSTAAHLRRSLCGDEDRAKTTNLLDEVMTWTAYSPLFDQNRE